MKIRHELEIESPMERLWALTVAVEAWPAITPTITSVVPLDRGPMRVGWQARLKQPGLPPRVWTVTTFEPPHRFAWSMRVLGTTMTAVHDLAATDSGTRHALEVHLTGWASIPMGLLLRIPIARALAQENEAFQRAVRSPGSRAEA